SGERRVGDLERGVIPGRGIGGGEAEHDRRLYGGGAVEKGEAASHVRRGWIGCWRVAGRPSGECIAHRLLHLRLVEYADHVHVRTRRAEVACVEVLHLRDGVALEHRVGGEHPPVWVVAVECLEELLTRDRLWLAA